MKKQILKSALIAVAGIGLLAGSAMADFTSLQTILNERTQGGPSSVDAATEMLSDFADSYWNITASGGSVNTIVIELAGFSNTSTFGIYDRNNAGNKLQIFNGAATANTLSAKKTLYYFFDIPAGKSFFYTDSFGYTDLTFFSSNTFGYYLNADGKQYYYSDSSLNNGEDHMVAYQGENDQFAINKVGPYTTWTPNEYILAWEDLPLANSDKDYDDFVVMVESVQPIPEPATMMLFGTGIIGLAGIARRRKTN